MRREPKRASFVIHGGLRDFVSRKFFHSPSLEYRYWGSPSLKDAVEAIGVPHTEVSELRSSGRSCFFEERLDAMPAPVEVHPFSGPRPMPSGAPRFALDVNLGRLAEYLRALGFDCFWRNGIDDKTLVEIATGEDRVILTRDVGVLKRSQVRYGAFVHETKPREQLKEIVAAYGLRKCFQPFSRCMNCNGTLRRVPTEQVEAEIPPRTAEIFDEFFRCNQCSRVYWKGSHYESMLQWMSDL